MVTRLRPDVWWLDLGGVNAYLVDDGDLTLVDAGMPWTAGRLLDGVVEAGFAVDDLDRVLVTHYDADHVGGLARLPADVTVYAGGDAPLVAGRRSPPLSSRKGLSQRLLSAFVTPPTAEVVEVADGDTVGSFTVYETPGHTPGHVAYVSETLSTALVGDLVRESTGRLKPSPWVISDDTAAVRESVRDLAERAPEFAVAAMGHGVPFQRGGSDRIDDLAAGL